MHVILDNHYEKGETVILEGLIEDYYVVASGLTISEWEVCRLYGQGKIFQYYTIQKLTACALGFVKGVVAR